MIKHFQSIPGTPAVAGPYSQAVVSGGFVFTAGQIPVSPLDNQSPPDFEQQVRQIMINLRQTLLAAGSDLQHVVKVNGYLTHPDQLEVYNRVYREFMGDTLPARTTVCVSLWGVSMEIDCIAECIHAPQQAG